MKHYQTRRVRLSLDVRQVRQVLLTAAARSLTGLQLRLQPQLGITGVAENFTCIYKYIFIVQGTAAKYVKWNDIISCDVYSLYF